MAADRRRTSGLGLGWLASVILSLVTGVLLYVESVEVRSGQTPLAPLRAPSNVDCSAQQAQLATQIASATGLLQATGLPLPTPIEETQGADRLRYVHRRYELAMPTQSLGELKKRLQPLSASDPCLTVDLSPEEGGARIRVGIDEVLTHTVVLHWIVPTPQRVRLAIVIEDLGGDLLSARELTSVDAPLAFAVVPDRPFAREVGELARLFNREVLLDLRAPAKADDEPAEAPTASARPSEDDTYQRLDQSLASVPYAVGVKEGTNAQIPEAQVLGWLKLHQLFFVARDATPDRDGQQLAAALGVATAGSVVIDSVPEEGAIRAQLDALVKAARERGAVIGVGHPHGATITALRAVLPQWRDAGFDVTTVSAMVRVPTLAAE